MRVSKFAVSGPIVAPRLSVRLVRRHSGPRPLFCVSGTDIVEAVIRYNTHGSGGRRRPALDPDDPRVQMVQAQSSL